MKRLFLLLVPCLLVTVDAYGQSLSDRINYVMEQRARAQAQNQDKGQMLGALLYTDVTVQFEEIPAREAIDYLKTILGVNIIARYNDDRTGTGIDPESPITLNVVGEPGLTVLEMVLDQSGDEFDEATWQLRNGYVEVGTKERLAARSAQEIRYYPIRDLLFEPPMFDNAPELDLDQALSQATQTGGGGGGSGGGGGGFGGGGGGGGGGSGGGGGGGSIFGDPGDDPERLSQEERAQQIVDLIVETVEPEAWEINGGDWASVRFYQGTLIIRAPDFVHRQIGGYPFAIRPFNASRASVNFDRRYVTFSGGISDVSLIGLDQAEVGGAAGR